MRALDLWRKAGDARGAADESHDIGLVFQRQGRFGAAVHAIQDAVEGYRKVGDRGSDMAALLTDLADALAQSGRGSESEPILHEAQSLVDGLKNENLKAQLLAVQGDVRRYAGDTKSADTLYQEALQTALRSSAPEAILISRLRVAEAALALNKANPDSSIREFRKLTQQADTRNLKHLSLESSVDTAEAMIARKDYVGAQRELQAALGKSEKLGSRYQSARIHYLLGVALRLSGNKTDASQHYAAALNLMNEMQKEAGAEKLLERSDLKTMFPEATRFATSTH